MALRQCIVFLAISRATFATDNAREGGSPPDADKGRTQQVVVEGGWLSFGTSFADEDVVKEFAPEDPEGEQIETLKESLGADVFGAIAGATGMDKRPDSLSRDGAKAAKHLRVAPFSIDSTAVSNEEFKRFVRATGYKTEAENYRWSFVLELLASNDTIAVVDGKQGLGRVVDAPWWLGVEGATWRKPEGPDSSLKGRGAHPAIHISWNDAKAYCEWVGKRLPTEFEWEMAARGGYEDEPFPWGDADYDFHTRLNSWEGHFPDQNLKKDGYIGTAPVDAYAPNPIGVYNMLGNVWEWCDGSEADKKPLRGGSYVDTVDGSHNHALRVSTRMDQTPDSGSANTGVSDAFVMCVTRACAQQVSAAHLPWSIQIKTSKARQAIQGITQEARLNYDPWPFDPISRPTSGRI